MDPLSEGPAPPDPDRLPTAGAPWRRGVTRLGFTLLEIMIVSVILGSLAAVAVPRLNEALFRAQVARSIGDLKALEVDLYDFWVEHGRLPGTLAEIGRDGLLDAWGRPYRYLPIAPSTAGGGGNVGQYRKDRFLVPLNSDFDLYSAGADGRTQAPLGAAASQDDVLRANDGGFIGLASEY